MDAVIACCGVVPLCPSCPLRPDGIIEMADPSRWSTIPGTLGVPALPDDNPKTRYGLAKPAMSSVPPGALIPLMRAMADGRRKYGMMNWRDKPVSATTYYDAAMRHLLAWFDGEETAEDSGVEHLGHAMACLGILLDAKANGCLNDDRPTKGVFGALVKQHTKPMENA